MKKQDFNISLSKWSYYEPEQFEIVRSLVGHKDLTQLKVDELFGLLLTENTPDSVWQSLVNSSSNDPKHDFLNHPEKRQYFLPYGENGWAYFKNNVLPIPQACFNIPAWHRYIASIKEDLYEERVIADEAIENYYMSFVPPANRSQSGTSSFFPGNLSQKNAASISPEDSLCTIIMQTVKSYLLSDRGQG